MQMKRCLTRAGQALEMKVYMTVQDIPEEDGTPVYNKRRQYDFFEIGENVEVLFVHS